MLFPAGFIKLDVFSIPLPENLWKFDRIVIFPTILYFPSAFYANCLAFRHANTSGELKYDPSVKDALMQNVNAFKPDLFLKLAPRKNLYNKPSAFPAKKHS